MKHKRFFALAVALTMLTTLVACYGSAALGETSVPPPQTPGQIYLYGEQHANEKILDKEFELWREYYHSENMRHLFVELPYYTAEFLNLWMQSHNDDILEAVYRDWVGTQSQNPVVKDFYIKIKKECPETVFHGTDVGHQHDATGERYLKQLKENNMEQSEQFLLAQEAIEQGKYYYKNAADLYRENKMAENFIREFDTLGGESVMGIYGTAHTGLDGMDYKTQSIPNMANQLKARYGEAVHSEDLSLIASDAEPLRTDKVTINGKEYEATYFEKQDLTGFKDYAFREFWRLENAHDDFKDKRKTGDVLPYNNYPMPIEAGQVFVIDYTKTNGSVTRQYYRSDGAIWQGMPATEEFRVE